MTPWAGEGNQLPIKAGGMDHDVLQAKEQYLPGPEWDLVRKSVPILCVDVLLSPAGDSRRVGLIRRDAPQGQGWCLVGGRVLRNEHLPVAVERHVAATLGPGVRVDRSTLELGAVIEYFTEPGLGEFCDPRKHAVSMTYSAECECTGAPEARGEAHEFGWFSLDQLPGLDFGFGQGEVVARVLKKLGRV
jgi:ADP-ribose pyrophosphatase YjhB (NUDIX family)